MKILFASDLSFNCFDRYPGDGAADAVMRGTAEVFRGADFRMVNLENVLGKAEDGAPIVKSGPNLLSDEAFVRFLDALNPTVVGLANNHAGDYGDAILLHTIDLLKGKGCQCAGAGKNLDEAYLPAVLTKDGVTVEIFAVCENEFGIAEDDKAGAAGYRLSRVTAAILGARERGNLPIVYFHGGNETNPLPSPGKVELYRHFVDLGAAAVVGMHTHCPQGYEFYRGSPIVYSMGNFYFPSDSFRECGTWNCGYLSLLDVREDGIGLEVIPYRFDFTSHEILSGRAKENFLNYLEEISRPIADPALLQSYFDAWCTIAGIGGYLNDVVFSDAMLTDPAKIGAVAKLKNIFSCEAHNELIRNTMKIIFEGRTETAKARVGQIRAWQNPKF